VIPKSKSKENDPTNRKLINTPKKDVESDAGNKVEEGTVDSNKQEFIDATTKDKIPNNKELTPQRPLDIINTNIEAPKAKESRIMSTGSLPNRISAKDEAEVTPRRATTSSVTDEQEHGMVNFGKSPRMTNDYTEGIQ